MNKLINTCKCICFSLFQVNDGVPIYLKGGAMDKILYQTTLVLCWVGVFGTIKFLYDLSYTKLKKNDI